MKKNKSRKINWKVLIISFIFVYAIAFLGSLLTSPVVKTDWYNSIKPSITPPSYIFPIVWNILFFLIALSLYLVWTNAKDKREKHKIGSIFILNLALNLLWSILFFGFKNPLSSLIEIILLLISIVLMIEITHKINKLASYLLIPYLIWVSFATILNFLIAIK